MSFFYIWYWPPLPVMWLNFLRRAQFSQARVILKREPAPIKSQQTAVQAAEKDKCCLSGVHPVAVIAWKASSFVPDGWTKSCLRQTTVERRMSLATREQKAVVTDFCACRALWFFHAMKERIRIRLNKEKLTGHREVYSNTISSIEYYTSITGATHLLGRTQNLLSLAKSASRLLLMRSSLMPIQQAATRWTPMP